MHWVAHPWTAAVPYPGWVSLRRWLGSRNRALAALVPWRPQIFPQVAGGLLEPASPALPFQLPPAGKHLGSPRDRPVCGPFPRVAAT